MSFTVSLAPALVAAALLQPPLPAVPAIDSAASLVPAATRAAAADPAAPAGSVTWSITPANADGPDGRVSARHELDPGATVTDYVTISNLGPEAARFEVYASDGVVSDDGLFDLLPSDATPEDGGSWVTIGSAGAERETVEIGPESSVTIPYEITVPADATPGDHPAGVVAALVADDDSAVAVDTRVGVRLHLRVTGEIAPALEVQDLRVAWEPSWNPFEPGTVRVTYEVANTGNVRLGAQSEATVSGPFGIARTSADGSDRREILPGQSAAGSAEVRAWPLFVLTGEVTVVPGVVGDDQVAAVLDRAPASFTVTAVPWWLVGVLAALIVLVLVARACRRRRARHVQRQIDAAVAAARAEEPARV